MRWHIKYFLLLVILYIPETILWKTIFLKSQDLKQLCIKLIDLFVF